MAQQIIKFTKERDTKNTVRFNEVVAEDAAAVIGTLYVQKWFVQGATELTVTVVTE